MSQFRDLCECVRIYVIILINENYVQRLIIELCIYYTQFLLMTSAYVITIYREIYSS